MRQARKFLTIDGEPYSIRHYKMRSIQRSNMNHCRFSLHRVSDFFTVGTSQEVGYTGNSNLDISLHLRIKPGRKNGIDGIYSKFTDHGDNARAANRSGREFANWQNFL